MEGIGKSNHSPTGGPTLHGHQPFDYAQDRHTTTRGNHTPTSQVYGALPRSGAPGHKFALGDRVAQVERQRVRRRRARRAPRRRMCLLPLEQDGVRGVVA